MFIKVRLVLRGVREPPRTSSRVGRKRKMSDLSPEDEVALIAATVEPEVAAAVRAMVEEVAEPSGGSSSCSESADTVANEDARGLGVNGTKAKPAKNGAAAKKQSARRPLTPPPRHLQNPTPKRRSGLARLVPTRRRRVDCPPG